MKTKIISVLLCVCMLAGIMTIAGMAESAVPITTDVSLKDPLKIDKGTTIETISKKENMGNYVNSSNNAANWETILKYYSADIKIVNIGGKDYLRVVLTEMPGKNWEGRTDGDDCHLKINGKGGNPDKVTAAVIHLSDQEITWVAKLYDLQMGVRIYGVDGDNLVASNIATVKYDVEGTSGVIDKLYDLKYGTNVTLTATLKEEYEEIYKFYCWVDGKNNVKWEDPITNVKITDDAAMFAVYREIKDRYVVTYKSNEGGKIVYNDSENLKIFEGDGQVSVLHGSSPHFTFVPDEGYEVSKVIVNEDGTPKEVSSIKTLFSSLFDAADFEDALAIFGTFADATNKDVYTYTFKNIAFNASIQVVFIKSKVYEPASGVEYVPGPELSTGTDDEADADGDGAQATVIPNEDGSPADVDVANPQTGSATAIAAFATLTVAAAAAFVTAKKKRS